MSHTLRRILFYSSFLVFLVAGFFLILYSLGYKYDFIDSYFVRTGSFEVRINTDADVYVNDKLEGKTSFLSSTFTQNRLLPRTYVVRIQNQDYQFWQKNVDVIDGLVTAFPNVVLIPKKISEIFVASSSFTSFSGIAFDAQNKTVLVSNGPLSENIDLTNGRITRAIVSPGPSVIPSPSRQPALNSSPVLINSPDNTTAIWFDKHEIWIQWLKDSGQQPYKKANDIELITRYSQTINDVQWYGDSAHLIANVGGILKFIETDTRGGLNAYDISSTSSPYLYLPENNLIYKFKDNILLKINLSL